MATLPKTITVDMLDGETSACILQIAVRFKGRRRFSFRLWLAGQLMGIAGRVCPVPVELSTDWPTGLENP